MLKDVLKEARSRKNLTQEEIAEKVKVAKQTYLKWETGVTEPKASQIRLLAQHLDITANEICNGVLFERYPLEDFIIEQKITRAPSDIISLRTWQYIQDHQGFIKSLESENLTQNENDMMELLGPGLR